MKKLCVLLMLCIPIFLQAQSGMDLCRDKHRSKYGDDHKASSVFDYRVTHFDINIDTILFPSQKLYARTGVQVLAENASCNNVKLDLLGFNIDTIFANGYSINYSYNDTVLDMQLTPAIPLGDSLQIWIHYSGNPAQDASGWGGFYFSGSYAFNLGVGFQADPHNYGRAWFPCQDNFTSRSRYDFHITTAGSSKAFCNGTLQQQTLNPDGTITWHWKLNQTIPSYLASMAVASYATLNRTSNGIPVQWAAMATDTNNVLATFANLDTTLSSFIGAYGPYPFDKVGYCLVPFNSGAMEHASSIHIGRAFVNGSQTYATLWAHELSHMWWGDKVTCETAQDMWLNEGFASYNEAFYTKVVSGEVAYRDWIRSNHRKVLQFAHTPSQDGSYLTLNNIPHEYTYGYHVYQKGANIVHTLKNYMGEQEFNNGCHAYMNNKAYSHANSYDLRDELTSGSGVNVNRFFDDWVFTPGFPHFSIDSVVYMPGGLDHYYVYTRQRSKGNNHLYEMPIELTFTNGTIDTTVRVVIDATTNMFHIPIYFYADVVFLDRYGKVSDARVSNEKIVTATGSQIIAETGVTLNVQTVGTPNSLVRIEHNFVPPDPFISSNPGIRLSDYRYWKVDGIFKPGFVSKAVFVYNGSTSPTAGYLDNTFITGTEDSLTILYRPGAGYNWTVVNSFSKNMGANLLDKSGTITVDTLMIGEYTLGYRDYTVGINEINSGLAHSLTVTPNPSDNHFNFQFDKLKNNGELVVYDLGGRKLFSQLLNIGDTIADWQTNKISSGLYCAVLYENNKPKARTKLLLEK